MQKYNFYINNKLLTEIISIFETKIRVTMSDQRFSVSSEELRDECLRRKYCELLSQPETFPSKENWEYIIDKRMKGLGPVLYRKYLVSYLLTENQRCDYHELALTYFPSYLKTVDRNYALTTVYSDIVSSPEATKELIYKCELFDSSHICDILDSADISFAVELLDAYQPQYDGDDIDAMQYLLNKITALPNIGCIELRKGIFSTERVYLCPDGHKNPVDTIYCRHDGCGKDIKGLTEQQHHTVENFAKRLDILREMLG